MESIAVALLVEEENNVTQNTEVRLEKRKLRDSCNPFEMSDQLFKKNFRLNKDAFKYVLETFAQEVRPCSLKSSSPLNHVVMALRFFAEGGYQHGVGADHNVGMSQSTVSKSLSCFLDIMQTKLCRQWIQFDESVEEKIQAKQEFYAKAGFPGVIMCVDGTHIKIMKPSEEEFLYNNRKGFFSINAMVILGICTIVVSCLALQNYQDVGRMICITMIVLGSIVFLISFFGCCGAVRENVCLTWTYASCLLMVIIGNSVIIFNYLNQLDGETKARQDINSAWTLQLNGKDGMSNIQTNFKCCGINNSTDYINSNLTIPNSCFVGGDYNKSTILFSEGCLTKLIAKFEAAEHWITIFIWSSLSVQAVAFISACVLAITFSNQQRRARY